MLGFTFKLQILNKRNNNNNGNFYSALPIKNLTAQGTYKSDTNNNNITQTHTHTNTHSHTRRYLRITCHQTAHPKRFKIKLLELHLHSLPLSLSRCIGGEPFFPPGIQTGFRDVISMLLIPTLLNPAISKVYSMSVQCQQNNMRIWYINMLPFKGDTRLLPVSGHNPTSKVTISKKAHLYWHT